MLLLHACCHTAHLKAMLSVATTAAIHIAFHSPASTPVGSEDAFRPNGCKLRSYKAAS